MERLTGVTLKSRMLPLALSWIINRFALNATVTQETASRAEISCPATVPFKSFSEMAKPSGRDWAKLSRYSFARNVP